MPLKFDKAIKASDVLTSLTIILSIIALMFTLKRDRDTRIREQADHIRMAAAKTLAKLERWQALQKSLYSELQLNYVETSEILDADADFNVVKVRDSLYKKIDAERVRIADRILSESIETAYIDLFASHPSIRATFLAATAKLQECEESAVSDLKDKTQDAVLSFAGKQAGYTTALLGNALRNAAKPIEVKFIQETNRILTPIRENLYTLISSNDETILARN
jgi:hypothetical protein